MTARARIQVRPATPDDVPFVRELSVESIVHGIPAGRRVSPEAAREYARSSVSRLDEWLARTDVAVLIAEMEGEAVGYLILDLADREPSTGERQAFIVDLAARRDRWGRYVPHHLVEAAARLAAERGLAYLVGMVSADNRRALVTSGRLDFSVERHQIVRRLAPSTPMNVAPGSPPGSHGDSRDDRSGTPG